MKLKTIISILLSLSLLGQSLLPIYAQETMSKEDVIENTEIQPEENTDQEDVVLQDEEEVGFQSDENYTIINENGTDVYYLNPADEETITEEASNALSNEELIWNFFRSNGFSEAGVAGIMGNLQAESGFYPNNLENSSNYKANISDDEFTRKVDSGEITRAEFISSSTFGIYSYNGYWMYGYGLAQWTYYSRKADLYDYWKSYGSSSISDLYMQLNFMMTEMSSSLKNYLMYATSPQDACVQFHNIYEGSADDASRIQGRVNNANNLYNKYQGTDAPDITPTIEDGIYRIESAIDNNYALDIEEIDVNESNLQILRGSQTFTVTYQGYGYYKITSMSGRALDVAGASQEAGANVLQYTDTGDANQQWAIKEAGDGYYYIVSKSNGLYLDVEHGNAYDNCNVEVWTPNYTAGQKWKFSTTVPISDISLNQTNITMYKGSTDSLVATIDPSTTTMDQTITWTTSDSSIASVDSNGVITALKAGEATITATTSNGKTATCTVTVKTPTSKVEGYSLSISSQIGVNFYMTLEEEVANSSTAYMKFTLPNKTTETVMVKDAYKKDNYYIFPCFVSAKDMTGTITAELYNQSKIGTYTYTVEDYANYIMNHTNQFDSKVVNIAKSMMTYGYYTQSYFDYNTTKLPSTKNSLTSQDLEKYAYTINDTNPDVDFIGARFILSSKPGLKLYFLGEGNFKVDNQSITTTTEGKYTVITINDINQFYKMYSIQCENLTLNYSLASFANLALNSSNVQLSNLAKAMVEYFNLF